ncbi:MAG TPA: sulfotransferase [Solirubrobacteraceae bacterium]|nr:sulfotransferase [Solirubrobacteraceae bacterium]
MKVIGAGLPRTGTLSQKVALEMLGLGPCYHMVNVLAEMDQAATWAAALAGAADFREVFADFESSVDWPGSFFYRELMEVFPDAKVLLSVRPAEDWELSMRETIWAIFYGDHLLNDLSRARGRVDPAWRSYIDMMEGMWEQSGLLGSGATANPGELARAFDAYNQQVIATVPADRLLVWSAADGWDPLCEFLGVQPPDVPFPRLNDSREFIERILDGSLLELQRWRNDDGVDSIEAATAAR